MSSTLHFLLLLQLVLSCLAIPFHDEPPHSGEMCLNLTASPFLQKYVDALPIIPVINLALTPRITLGAYKIVQKLHRDLPPTPMYAYGTSQETARYPGPTLLALQNRTAVVRWENHIAVTGHLLPLDKTLDWANPKSGFVPMVVHNHGQEDPGWSDGHPNGWFTAVGEHGPTYVTQDYVYPNTQRTYMGFYHDHTFGITRLNMAAGLVGAYLLESPVPEVKWAPSTYYTLVVQDKAFFPDGYIKYPDIGFNPAVHPKWCPEYLGDVILINGKAWPYLDVAPTTYRFRMVNAGNARFYNLSLSWPSLRFTKIGVDGGYLHTPISQEEIVVGPAERVDFLINFKHVCTGCTVELVNIGPESALLNATRVYQPMMLFRVLLPLDNHRPASVQPLGPVLTPEQWTSLTPAQIIKATSGVDLSHVDWNLIYYRPFVFEVELDSGGGLVALFLDDRQSFMDPPTEIIKLYTREVWVLINNIAAIHPIHLHLVNFLVIEQQPFNPVAFANGSCSFKLPYPEPESCYTGPKEPPDANQVGLKDTAQVRPFHVTKFYVVFRPNLLPIYKFDPTDFPGYVWHCHLLEHEDNEMMRPLLVTNSFTRYNNDSFSHADDGNYMNNGWN